MKNLADNAPEIIEKASQSPLGILALTILSMSIIALFFFKSAPVAIKVAIYLLITVSFVMLAFAAMSCSKHNLNRYNSNSDTITK